MRLVNYSEDATKQFSRLSYILNSDPVDCMRALVESKNYVLESMYAEIYHKTTDSTEIYSPLSFQALVDIIADSTVISVRFDGSHNRNSLIVYFDLVHNNCMLEARSMNVVDAFYEADRLEKW